MTNSFMQKAIELAIDNVRNRRGGPFGALIVRGPEVIAAGANCVVASNDPTAHAEIVAIRAAGQALKTFDLSGCDIYTSCEPCPMCLGAIYWARLDRIYYAAQAIDAASAGFDDLRFYSELSLPVEQRTIPMIHVMRDEALAAFEAWKADPQRVDY
jgi:guanine deaminase